MLEIEMQATSTNVTVEYEETAVLKIDAKTLATVRQSIEMLEALPPKARLRTVSFVAEVEWPDLETPHDGSFEIGNSCLVIVFDVINSKARWFHLTGNTHNQADHFRTEDLPMERLLV